MEEVSFLHHLLTVDSSNPPGNEMGVALAIVKRAEQAGLNAEVKEFAKNRCNVEIRLSKNRGKRIYLCGHMDTVSTGETEWKHPPFSGEIIGERMYGLGASDMKSGLASMYLALETIHKKGIPFNGEIVFLATAGEEVDCCGSKDYLISDQFNNVDALVIGEPTNEKVVIGHKGALWLEVTTYGRTAHGSMPEKGVNAVEQMASIIPVIKQFANNWKFAEAPFGSNSMAVTKIAGGVQSNVIPDRCTIHIDVRTLPGQSHGEVITQLNEKIGQLANDKRNIEFTIKPLGDRASLMTDPKDKIIKTALSLKGQGDDQCYGMSYITDGSILNRKNEIPTLIYGPGDESLAHQPNEYVSIQAYMRSIQFYKDLVLQYLSEE